MSPRAETRRHRHPDYPDNRCGAQVIVSWKSNGAAQYSQKGSVRRICRECRRKIKGQDLR